MPSKDYLASVEKLVGTLRTGIKEIVRPDRSCLTCDHFREDLETCQHSQHSGVRPPARIIAYGCALYENYDEDIPF